MQIRCPKCRQSYEVDSSIQGQQAECVCGEKFKVPTGVPEKARNSYREWVAALRDGGDIKRAPSAVHKKEILLEIINGKIEDSVDLLDWIDEHANELIPSAGDEFKQEYAEIIRDLKSRGILKKSPSAQEKEKILSAAANGKISDAVSLVKWCDKNTLLITAGTEAALAKAEYRRKQELEAIYRSLPERKQDEPPCTERQADFLVGKWLGDLKLSEATLRAELGKWQASDLIDKLKGSSSPYLYLSDELLDPLTEDEIIEFRQELQEQMELNKALGVRAIAEDEFVPIRLTDKVSTTTRKVPERTFQAAPKPSVNLGRVILNIFIGLIALLIIATVAVYFYFSMTRGGRLPF